MSHRQLLIAVLILLSAGLCATRGPENDEITKIVAEVSRKVASDAGLDVLSVVVAVEGEVVVDESFGRLDTEMRDRNAPHRVGPLLPQFIATAVLQLADQDKLSLDDDITKHFPELEMAKGVHVEHLLAHASGLPDFSGFIDGTDAVSTDEVMTWLKTQSLEFDPNHCAIFSLTNVALAGAVVEKVTGMALSDHLTNFVFEPSGMSSTRWCWDEPNADDDGACEQDLPGGAVEATDLPRLFASAGLCSTADDLQRWQRALVQRELVEDDSLSTFTSPRRLADGDTSFLTGGASAMRLAEIDGFGCGGTLGGFASHLSYYPDYNLGIVLLARGSNANLRKLERSIGRAVLDLPDPEVRDVPLTERERERYLGAYYIGCTQVTIESAGERLKATWPDESDYELRYQGWHVFVSADDDAITLTFDGQGDRSMSFQLFEHGSVTEARRLE